MSRLPVAGSLTESRNWIFHFAFQPRTVSACCSHIDEPQPMLRSLTIPGTPLLLRSEEHPWTLGRFRHLLSNPELSYFRCVNPELPDRSPQPILTSFRFLATSLIGTLAMTLVSVFADLPAQIAVLGALLSILVGLFLGYLEREDQREIRQSELLERLQVPLALASDKELFGIFTSISSSLTTLSSQNDSVLREFAQLKLTSLAEQLASLAEGTIVFGSTEGWRTVYEALLKSSDILKYYSVAWVKTREYWQDAPGRQSMQKNFDAAYRGVLIERTFILPDSLWPAGNRLPTDEILPWIEEQYNHGIWVTLVQESALRSEPDLLGDFGIYGERAVGVQELDDRCRTQRFVLYFDQKNVKLAFDRWKRLALYAISLSSLLDQPEEDR